jgi:hypothetical protein
MKKICFIFVTIFALLISGCSKDNEMDAEEIETPKYISKCYIGNIDKDGWFKFLCIELPKINKNSNETTNNFVYDGNASYVFDGINLKYKTLDGYYIPMYDDNNNEISKVEAAYPSYSISKSYREDIKKINKFLNDKKFERKISIEDLDTIDFKVVTKEELVFMFNSAFDKTPSDLGNYINIPFVSIAKSIYVDDYFYQVGYYCEYGNIRKIDIEVIYDGDVYLSNLVINNEASNGQIILYKKLKEIEEYIITNQDFEITKFKEFDESLKPLSNLLVELSKYE